MANWERKSHYLLREIVKFRTYIDTLGAAQVQKQKIYAEREALEEQALDDGEAISSSSATENDGAREAPTPHAPVKPNTTTPAFLLHP